MMIKIKIERVYRMTRDLSSQGVKLTLFILTNQNHSNVIMLKNGKRERGRQREREINTQIYIYIYEELEDGEPEEDVYD